MKTVVVPHPKLKRDYQGRTVRLVRDASNSLMVIPAGKIATIDIQSRNGSILVCEPCSCCGVRVKISGVQPDDIEFVNIEQN